MKFRKEMLIFSLITIFLLMSAVSAEENITDDGAITSDNIELDSYQDYNVSDDSILEDSIVDDENISEEDIEPDYSPDSMKAHDASVKPGYTVVSKNSFAIAGACLNKDFTFHKSSSRPHYPDNASADLFNERSINERFSDFQSPACPEALADIVNDISSEDIIAQTESSYSKYFDYLKWDSLKGIIDEDEIGDVFNGNTPIIDFKTIDCLKHDLIKFMAAGAEYADSSIADLFDVNAFLDIFDKIMNMPSTHNVMTSIPSSNNSPTFRNHNHSDYCLYPDADSIINHYDLNDDEDSFMEPDSNVTDILIVQDNIELINQTSDLKTVQNACINSYEDNCDLQTCDAGDYRHSTYNNPESAEMQSLKLGQQINCLSVNMSEDIQHAFYHIIGCECSDTSFTKQYESYDNLPEVREFNTIASDEKEDNHDNVLFKKYNVNAPFIVENTSVFALFGVIKITIP